MNVSISMLEFLHIYSISEIDNSLESTALEKPSFSASNAPSKL